MRRFINISMHPYLYSAYIGNNLVRVIRGQRANFNSHQLVGGEKRVTKRIPICQFEIRVKTDTISFYPGS